MAIPNIKADYDGIGDGDDDANMVLAFSFMLIWLPDMVSQAAPILAMPLPPPALRKGIVPDLLMVVYSGEHYLR